MNYLRSITKQMKNPQTTPIPTVIVEGLKIDGFDDLVNVPLATYEQPLWHSVGRGGYISSLTEHGIEVAIKDDRMTRSVIFEAKNITEAVKFCKKIELDIEELQEETKKTSRFAKLLDIHSQIVSSLIYIRFEFQTGDASGHNMVTKASQALMNYILSKYNELKYVSISGNYCTDKKVSAVNGILGRGKYCIANLTISREICKKHLRCTPEEIVKLNVRKNLIGSILAGSLRSANAHFANMLLAIYLATGQDAANIVEASQGIALAEINDSEDLEFSVTLPNIIVGTVGNGKHHDFIRNNLELLGCANKEVEPGENTYRLAKIIAAVVLCGELSLLAAQSNEGELVKTHMKIER